MFCLVLPKRGVFVGLHISVIEALLLLPSYHNPYMRASCLSSHDTILQPPFFLNLPWTKRTDSILSLESDFLQTSMC
jgi:hypothetical protein